ncbi:MULTISPECIES: hypothetical protein [Burkholderia]|uniref:hypothetical protein n=1 Tax=Burkholderia TaxID=32008 RepID=UPI000F5A6165|nr:MULTISPECIES: hypothetical protein [Burkholderia]RQR28048.1 hypothetical protein DIE23_25080 [Burkholderia sp. Bp9143]TGB32843.1 hypothetical protein C6946_15520 [Burkholderia thailandensis]
MAAKQSTKAKAWVLFDRIVDLAAPSGAHSNPWKKYSDGQLCFEPDYDTLVRLLGVPLYLNAETQSGVPALALDVWLSYELRRAGFGKDQAWPRPVHPRILPAPVAALLKELPRKVGDAVAERLTKEASIRDVTSSSASILGKNYLKQVDVIITDWATGPELLISTKRMDSSYGKNAPNRVEESYGDAKNLRLRHPLAALGFVFGLRSDILQKEPRTAAWLFDLLGKLGREDDAYHATCLVLMEYADDAHIPDTGEERHVEGVPEPGLEPDKEEDLPAPASESEVDREIARLPKVTILEKETPEDLAPGRFLAAMVTRVLDATPVNMHETARQRRASPELG